jgi:enoyl-CoA hydratase
MAFEHISYEKDGGVGTIRLERPQKMNAIHFALLAELGALLEEIRNDTHVKVVLVTGAGKCFCAGADLEILSSLSPQTFRPNQDKYWNRVFCELEDLPKPTIAAINGPAIGGGLELALCCDLRYTVDDATFLLPQINFGLIPDVGATIRLPRLIGLSKAKEFILSGDPMTAHEAKACGLVDRVFSRETYAEAVKKMAGKLSQKSLPALAMGKQLINRAARHNDVRLGLADVTDGQMVLLSSEEYQKGMDAFIKKNWPDSKKS